MMVRIINFLRRPAVILLWLRTAWVAYIALVLVLILVPSILPGMLDKRLEEKYPPITKKKYFGLIKNTYVNPQLQPKKEQARTMLWAGSGGLIAFLFIVHIPGAMKRAEAIARKREEEADVLRETDLTGSMLLYGSAMKFSTDAQHITLLKEKMTSLKQKGSNRYGALAAQLAGDEETVVEPPSEKTPGETVLHNESTILSVGPEGRYRIKGTLGSGAMGVTHRAFDVVLEREVALKELLPGLTREADAIARFRQEAKLLAQLNHPGIVQVHDFIEDGGRIWIVLELVRGGELSDLLRERGRLAVHETARLAVQMAEAMAYAHSQGIVHRDFKPSNVMLTSGGQPKITDFGLAKLAQSAHHYTQTDALIGSPAYMSPEQSDGKSADARSDIYSMGIVLYKMLTGKVPFDGDTIASVLGQHVNKEPDPPGRLVSEIPEEIDGLVLRMLAKSPDKRIQDMFSVAVVLQKYQNSR